MLERYGDVDSRAYTAFMFFEVLLKHLKAPKIGKDHDNELKFKKPHTAATRYLNLYAAADTTDAQGKDPAKVNMILNRSLMWDASKVPGCQSCYTFKTGAYEHRTRIGAVLPRNLIYRNYPCPFRHCACMRSHIDVQAAGPLPCVNDDNILAPDPWNLTNITIKKKTVLAGNDDAADRGDGAALERGDELDEGVVMVFSQELEEHLRDVLSEAKFIPPFFL